MNDARTAVTDASDEQFCAECGTLIWEDDSLVTGACRSCRGAHGPGVTRTVAITNEYEDGTTIVVEETIELRPPIEFADDDTWHDYVRDAIFPLTGAGYGVGNDQHRSLDAAYFVASTDGLEPAISLEYA